MSDTVLGIGFRGGWRFTRPTDDICIVAANLIDKAQGEFATEVGWFPGEAVQLTVVNRREVKTVPVEHPKGSTRLLLSVNKKTGYGALTWYAMEGHAHEDHRYNHVWVTDSAEAPSFDPRVVADPSLGTFYHPRSAIPISQVRAAIEEFGIAGTGDLPQCVRWVRGDMGGWRLDVEPRPKLTHDFPDPFA